MVPGLCHVSPRVICTLVGAQVRCPFRCTPDRLASALQVHTAVWDSPL